MTGKQALARLRKLGSAQTRKTAAHNRAKLAKTAKKKTSASRLSGWILLLGLALSCSDPTVEVSDALPSSPHPLALLVLDGLRVDSIDGMPFLKSFATEAVRFDWAFSQAPDATASLASTLTGLYPTTHGLVEPGESLTDDALTLAELLGETGLPSAAFLDFSEAIDESGLEQGFTTFETGSGALEAAATWVATNAGKSYLLLAGSDAASVAVEQGDPSGAKSRFDATLAELDKQVRGLVEKLGESATVVLVATRGSELAEPSTTDGPTLHVTRARVPLMIRLPRSASAQRIDKIVELVDLSPTILELSGTSVPLEVQGSSLLPLIQGEGKPPYIAFGESPHHGGQQYAVLAGYRLILSTDGDRVELYELATDPLETKDLAEGDPRRTEVLKSYLAAWGKMIAATSLDPDRRTEELDDATLEQLKSLGYIQ